MRLVIVSHTPHYRTADEVTAWGPTVREIDHLAKLFEEVVHVAPLHKGAPTESALAYESAGVRWRSVSPAGGPRLADKFAILVRLPQYLNAMLAEMRRADVVHVRCPANISLLAIILISLMRAPRLRWLKYAGNWQPDGREPWSYAFQRWWLKSRAHGGVVTVNGKWPNQPSHIHSFLNPCLTDRELIDARTTAAGKQLTRPLRLLFVGRLEAAKGVARVLQIFSRLHRAGVSASLDLVGDGPEREVHERLASDLGVDHLTTFHGWLSRPDLAPLYARSHIIIFPSACSEGWPKVLSEAMAYGVVPVSSNVSSIPQYLKVFETGQTFDADDVAGFAGAIALYYSRPERWKEESEKGVQAAHFFGYSYYLNAVRGLLSLTSENNGGVSASPPPVYESRKHEAFEEALQARPTGQSDSAYFVPTNG